ncbi:MAG: PIG-L family deacetylase [Nostocaceae cyanobacterium]|nr:PIG-L family deacetylase [Nostocaceae cyanobacterium]
MNNKKSPFRRLIGSKLRQIYSGILFQSILRFRSRPLAVSEKSAMVFAPHQDDETIACGGTIALKCAREIPVQVVFLTDGRIGRPDWIKDEDIIDYRQQEAIKALEILGVAPASIRFLKRSDGTLMQLSDTSRQQLITELAQMIQAFRPAEVYVPHKHDRHLDHEATYNLVQAAIAVSGVQVELFQYPVWILWQSPMNSNLKLTEISGSHRVFIGEAHERKNRAIAVYKSQINSLPQGFLNRFRSNYEIFIKT